MQKCIELLFVNNFVCSLQMNTMQTIPTLRRLPQAQVHPQLLIATLQWTTTGTSVLRSPGVNAIRHYYKARKQRAANRT